MRLFMLNLPSQVEEGGGFGQLSDKSSLLPGDCPQQALHQNNTFAKEQRIEIYFSQMQKSQFIKSVQQPKQLKKNQIHRHWICIH